MVLNVKNALPHENCISPPQDKQIISWSEDVVRLSVDGEVCMSGMQ